MVHIMGYKINHTDFNDWWVIQQFFVIELKEYTYVPQ